MSGGVPQSDRHPLLEYGAPRGWDRKRVAEFFDIPYSTFKQLVTGHTAAAFHRAEGWERVSRGSVLAIDVMRWQERNRKRPAA